MINKPIFITCISLFLFGCGNTSNDTSKDQTEIAILEEHNHNDESDSIELNNGKKWVVDANMMVHIRNMENDISSLVKKDFKDYMALAVKLQANLDLLTSNCTMEGKAHDELHKWLLPYIDLVNDLSGSKDEAEASKQFSQLENSFLTFNQFFQ
jgi:hypothetical protein